jgi:hypothetical protein
VGQEEIFVYLPVLARGFQMDVYRCGIVDKTEMYEGALRMNGHDSSIWV